MNGLIGLRRFRFPQVGRERPVLHAGVSGRRAGVLRASWPAAAGVRRVAVPKTGSAFFLTIVILALSLLGFVYLIEISRVASLGYTLSTLRERQDQLEHEQSLLIYQLSAERTLAQVNHIARDQYGMRPFEIVRPETAPKATTRGTVPSGGATASPGRQFLTVRRPDPTPAPRATPAPAAPNLGDRLWRNLAGIGVAGGGAP